MAGSTDVQRPVATDGWIGASWCCDPADVAEYADAQEARIAELECQLAASQQQAAQKVQEAIRRCAEVVKGERLEHHTRLVTIGAKNQGEESDEGYSHGIADAESAILALLSAPAEQAEGGHAVSVDQCPKCGVEWQNHLTMCSLMETVRHEREILKAQNPVLLFKTKAPEAGK